MEPQDSPHCIWTIQAEAKPHEPGSGLVTIRLSNRLIGDVPPFSIITDWHPGAEAGDVEARAIALLGDAAKALAQTCAVFASGRFSQGR